MSSTTTAIPYYTKGTWAIDPVRSELRFSVRHLGIHRARGSMSVSGDVVVHDEPTESTVSAIVDLRSVSTGNSGRDNAIRSPKLLDVDRNPHATYRSTRLVAGSGNPQAFVVHGELEVLGTSGEVPLRIHVEFVPGTDRRRIVLEGQGRFNRHDFGVRPRVGPRFLDRAIASLVDVDVHLEAELQDGDRR